MLGSLTLGGYDQSRFTPHGLSFHFATDISRDLVVGLQSITYTDNNNADQVLLSEAILTFVDATIPHIWLPEDACKAFENAFNLQYNFNTNRYLVNDTLHEQLQARNASVTFTLSNERSGSATIDIILPYAAFDLQLGPPFVNSTRRYFPLRRADNDTQYTLGRTFLQETYVPSNRFRRARANFRGRYLIVDYERSNFSLSQSLFESNAGQQIVTIPSLDNAAPGNTKTSQPSSFPISALIGILVAVVVLALASVAAFFFFRRRRRRRLEEYEKRKAGDFDPLAKPEMDGRGKPPVGELYAEGKPGAEMDSKNMIEMEGTYGKFGDEAKMRAEMEGSRGGAEMEGTKGGHEMQAGDVTAPMEMWAGPHGLYELPSPDSGRPSPASRIPSPSPSGRTSPASPRDSNGRYSRVLSWGRINRHKPSLPRNGSEILSPTKGNVSEQESDVDFWSPGSSSKTTPPLRSITPQDISSPTSRSRERARRGEDLTRRLESTPRKQSARDRSVSSPTSETSHDRWNTRFGSRLRESTSSGGPKISSQTDLSRSRERPLPPHRSNHLQKRV